MFQQAESTILPLEESQTALSLASLPNPSPTSPPLNHLDISDADVIIQSCDLVDFRVHRRTLAMSSPFFDDMFSLPQPQPSDKGIVDGLPVVRLPEDAEVLSGLITMLYPIPSKLPNAYDKALTLLATSQKYDMVGVQSRIRGEIQTRMFPTLTGPKTFRSYAIASSGQLPSEAEKLARLTLEFPMTFEYLCDELSSFKGWALRDLVGFRKRCRDNIVSCFESFLKLDQPPFNIWVLCTDGRYSYAFVSTATGCSPSWLTQLFQKLLNESREAFSKPLFNPQSIRDLYLSALKDHISSYRCIACTKVHALDGERFCKELTDRLTVALSEVCTSSIFGGMARV
ncbi:hypothetical protein DFH94DRAFT_626335 [Russula ochroleuca]|jgi:hypothetical protein|uniref:BTB domain-containing protein n=1 Tax=Russula ochroleuca TaxID=152965 RepID=A0A9P5TC55_9AGAM|nr:hypothetical protein DFH94DRAFT_626335 [Russula ochroleuca]